MSDNVRIKDGLGNLFTLRSRDVSPNQDGSIQRSMMLDSLYPTDYGVGGMFQCCVKSGVMAAGIAANSPIFSFYWSGVSPEIPYALVRKLRLIGWSVIAFQPGNITFDMFAIRKIIQPDSGGNVISSYGSNMLRTSMASSLAGINYANTGALIPGNRTVDVAPLDSQTVPAPQTINTPFSPQRITLFEKLPGEHPLLLVANEGFIVQVTVPPAGVGTWQFTLTVEWDEISTF